MQHFRTYIIAIIGMICSTCTSRTSFEEDVKRAVNEQIKVYPESSLRDLYKNFFQDRFGPGHLIADTAAAAKYLRHELASCDESVSVSYEPTGWQGNFYRVNLSVVKENLVPYELYLDAFVRSANSVRPLSSDEWQKEWNKIDAVIRTMHLSLTNEDSDRSEINDLLERGDYVMHHSDRFETAYHPHYRIIEKQIFKKEILPYLISQQATMRTD